MPSHLVTACICFGVCCAQVIPGSTTEGGGLELGLRGLNIGDFSALNDPMALKKELHHC